MKTLGVIIVMICLLMQTFSKGVVLLEYRLNKDFIAKNLCENRSRPKMKCNGRCQLMKQWKAEDDRSASEKASKSNFTESCFTDHITLPDNFSSVAAGPEHHAFYKELTSTKHIRPLLHPPGC